MKLVVFSKKHSCHWCSGGIPNVYFGINYKDVLIQLVSNILHMPSNQNSRKGNLGFISCHNSYGIISSDHDGALFSVKVVVPKALSVKYNGNFIDDTFDPTMLNKV
jgi:hypothetical protein